MIEGSGPVEIAALLAGKVRDGAVTVALVSGGNIDMDLHKRIIDSEDGDVEISEDKGSSASAGD